MILPRLDSVKLYNKIFQSTIIDEVVDLALKIHNKIISTYNLRSIILVSVLRSGYCLTGILKRLFNEIDGVVVEIVYISLNNINNLDGKFKEYINLSHKDFIFVDGWISGGITYKILKEYWEKQKIKKPFKMAILFNF